MDIVPYKGWPKNLRLANADCELIATLDVGPRVISYRLADGPNVLKNYDRMMGGTGEAGWQIRGGLRFWIGPEDLTRTYFADNRPVAHEEIGPNAVRLKPPPEDEYGLQKVMELRLADAGTRVDITLNVTNIAGGPARLAAWGPTVMAPGGVEVIPLPEKKPHPGHPSNADSPKDFAPDQTIAVWPYFDFTDARWSFGSRHILLRQDPAKGPTKLGFAHREGWVGYVNQGCLFVQRFGFDESAVYPDNGVNYQTFSNEDMLEMEPIGPLVTLPPGASTELAVSWELFGGIDGVADEADAARRVRPLAGG